MQEASNSSQFRIVITTEARQIARMVSKRRISRLWTQIAVVATGAAAVLLSACGGPDESEAPVDGAAPAEGFGPPVLRVAAVYNDEAIQIRFEFPTDNPVWYHQYWIFDGNEWIRHGSGADGPDEHGLYEDRISMMLDDGSVEHFGEAGGFVAVHHGMRSLPSEADPDEVRAHPHLGERLGESDVRKFISASREGDPGEDHWKRVRDPAELERLRADGVFLDLWQWRAHRSHPVGYADNGYVLDYRHSSAGTGPYTTNALTEAGHPDWMFDPAAAGFRALRFEGLKNREYGQEDLYYLTEAHAAPFDPDHDWQAGDAIPQRFLREPSGSRGAIRADGGYSGGAWRIRLTRSLESPDPLDSKELRPGEEYTVAFAVHSGGVGARHHLVSQPVTLSLAADSGAEIQAVRAPRGTSPDDAEARWTEIPLFMPGTATWDQMHGHYE